MTERNHDLSDVVLCAKCNKPTRAARTGTITQWIAGCDCELAAIADDSIEVDLCYDCGKRINTGRAGSLTQWIFRTDCCTCSSTAKKPTIAQKVLAQRAAEEQAEAERLQQSKTADEDAIRDLARGEFIETPRYDPISRLGTGASGSVFLCRDTLLHRKVALKKLRRTSAITVIDFQAEAQTCSKLKHPNIVSILDLASDDNGIPYMVMEYVDGITLEKYLQSFGPMSIARAMKLMDEICDALSYAHSLEIMHRDVKSSNILLSKEHSYLIDFGIAKFKGLLTDGDLEFGTAANTIAGSPLYMPPDQGLGFKYDERSEIYSVGCVLFEALTGSTPFAGATSLEILSMHAHEMPPTLADASPDVSFPKELEDVVAKCLEKQPDDRFQSMADLRAALNQIEVPNQYAPPLSQESALDFGDVNLTHMSNVTIPSSELTGEPKWGKKRVVSVAIFILLVTMAGGITTRLFQKDKQSTLVSKKAKAPKKLAQDFNDIDRREVIRKAIKRGETNLRFSSGFITDSDLELLKGYKKIVELDLMGNPITDKGLMQLNAPYAKKLVLTNCDVRTLEFLSNFPNLRSLYLEGTNITDDALKNLKLLPMLKELKLSETTISDTGLKNITAARSLEYAIAHGTRVTKAGAEAVSKRMPLTAIAPFQPRSLRLMLDQLNKFEAMHQYKDAIAAANKIIATVEKEQGNDAPLLVEFLLRRSTYKTVLHLPDSIDDLTRAAEIGRKSKNDFVLRGALEALLHSYESSRLDEKSHEVRIELIATIKRLNGPDSPDLLPLESAETIKHRTLE